MAIRLGAITPGPERQQRESGPGAKALFVAVRKGDYRVTASCTFTFPTASHSSRKFSAALCMGKTAASADSAQWLVLGSKL
jgi:hypothetical protein